MKRKLSLFSLEVQIGNCDVRDPPKEYIRENVDGNFNFKHLEFKN